MKYNRVLLVKFYTKVGYGPRRPPVGLGYIAEALKNAGIPYEVLDCDLGYTTEDLLEKVKNYKPDLIGISMVTLGYLSFYEIINQLKDACSCDIVVGGPHISTMREEGLADCPGIDYGIVGEADRSIVALCEGKPLDQIEGLVYRSNEEIRFNGVVPPIKDLDSLGFPTYEGFELEKYYGFKTELSLVTSRGCPYGCIYCSVRLIIGSRMRFRTANNVVDEVEHWIKLGYHSFAIMDDNFSHDRQRVLDICDEIERRGLSGFKISLANGLRADRVDRELLQRLKDVGAFEIQIGVEAASDPILKFLRKGEKIDTIRKSIELALDLNYDVGTCFLVGTPGEAWDDVQDSFRFVLGYPLTRAFFFNIIPYPGTYIYDYLKKEGLMLKQPEMYLGTLRQNSNEPVFYTPELSVKQRKKLLRQARRVSDKVRYKYLRNRLSRFGPLAVLPAFLGSWHISVPFLKRSRFFNLAILPHYLRTRKQKSEDSNQ